MTNSPPSLDSTTNTTLTTTTTTTTIAAAAAAAATECDDRVSRESFSREHDHLLLIGDHINRGGSASPRVWSRWLADAAAAAAAADDDDDDDASSLITCQRVTSMSRRFLSRLARSSVRSLHHTTRAMETFVTDTSKTRRRISDEILQSQVIRKQSMT